MKKKVIIISAIAVLVVCAGFLLRDYALAAFENIFTSAKTQFIEADKDFVKTLKEQKTLLDDVKLHKDEVMNFDADLSVPGAPGSGITISAKSDPGQKTATTEIGFGAMEKQLLDAKFVLNQNELGVSSKTLLDRPLLIQNKNLDQLLKKLGVGTVKGMPKQLPTEVDILSLLPTQESVQEIMDRYNEMVLNQVQDDQFTIKKDTVLDGFSQKFKKVTLEVNGEQSKALYKEVLGKMQNDQALIDWIYESVSKITTAYQADFQTKEEFQKAYKEFFVQPLKEIDTASAADLPVITCSVFVDKSGVTYCEDILVKVKDQTIAITRSNDQNGKTTVKLDTNMDGQVVRSTTNTSESQIDYTVKMEGKDSSGFTANVALKKNNSSYDVTGKVDMLVGAATVSFGLNGKIIYGAEAKLPDTTLNKPLVINDATPAQLKKVEKSFQKRIAALTGALGM